MFSTWVHRTGFYGTQYRGVPKWTCPLVSDTSKVAYRVPDPRSRTRAYHTNEGFAVLGSGLNMVLYPTWFPLICSWTTILEDRVSEAEKLFKKLIKKELPSDEIRKPQVEESIGALTAFRALSIELRSRCREVIMGDVTSCIQSLQPIHSDVV